ncbi:MAG: hypothetical protein ACKOTB_18655, partial [Planctomycetia bacterium]
GAHVGVSGGSQAVAEGLLTVFSLAAAGGRGRDALPGIWLVLAGWTSEPLLDPDGQPAACENEADEPVCRALAAALVPVSAVHAADTARGPLLSLHPENQIAGPTAHPRVPPSSVADELLALDAALAHLSRAPHHDRGDSPAWSYRGPWAMELRLTAGRAADSVRPLRKEAA